MYCVIGIAVAVCILLILTVLINPRIKIGKIQMNIYYWVAPLIGAILLVALHLLDWDTLWEGLTSSQSINPLKILTLFISMTTLSIFLDEAGFFSYLAGISLKAARTNQVKLFCILYALVSVLTIFTSNDIIILTFTPFICYFSGKAKIDPMPYLFGEFVAANTWSMMLIIGNPTNIYLATAAGVTFGSYIMTMWLPTILAGCTTFLLLLVIFRKSLQQPIRVVEEKRRVPNRGLVVIGLFHLICCTFLLVISSYVGLEMWLITLGFAVSLFITSTVYLWIRKKRVPIVTDTLKRAPWELIPFVLSMFVLVLGLESYRIPQMVCTLLGEHFLIIKYGLSSFLAANVMNNIPMAVAFSSIARNLPWSNMLPATYASIIGSNLGAYFTPLGALAGIMWAGILNRMGIEFSFKKYISYGVRISFPALMAALFGLYIVL
ncbi:MAG: SLC13 family permease [Lachnospiraceae bacterium]